MNDLRPVLSATAPYRLGPAGGVALMPCESAAALALPGFLPRWVRISNGGKPVSPGWKLLIALALPFQAGDIRDPTVPAKRYIRILTN